MRLRSAAVAALLAGLGLWAQARPAAPTGLQVIVSVGPAPVVTITAPTSSPTYDNGTTATITTIAGTAAPVGTTISRCTWTDNLGGSGTATGTTSWAIATVTLSVGSNLITVRCETALGNVGIDAVTVTYALPVSGSNPIAATRMPSGSATLPDAVLAAAGVQGGIPSGSWANCNNTNCNAIATGGVGAVNSGTLQTAIDGAQVNGVACSYPANPCIVRVRAGSFTLADGFGLISGVVVRGVGADATIFDINGQSPGCYGYAGAIGICGHPVSATTTNWTGGFTQGTSRITLTTRTGLNAGLTPLYLNQLDEADGYPLLGDIFLCDSAEPCSGDGGGAERTSGVGTSGRTTAQVVLVTDCVSAGGVSQACSGAGLVDINPPISMPNFRSGKTPQATWRDGTGLTQAIQYAGVEDLSFDYSDVGGGEQVGFEMANASNIWIKGVRVTNTGLVQNFSFLALVVSHVTIRSTYLYRPNAQAQASYPFECMGCGSVLFENNICQGAGCNPVTSNGSFSNSVVSYNLSVGNAGPGYINHGAGEAMNLAEGNIMRGVWMDVTEGSHHFLTVFRNGLIGTRYASGSTGITAAIHFMSHARFDNVVGNVIGDATTWTTYEGTSPNGFCQTDAYMFDLGAQGCTGTPPSDPRVAATLFRWGNWDEITSSSPSTNGDQTGTRFCAAPLPANCGTLNNGAGTPQNEVPSGITNYANPVPASQSLPSSLYLSTKPAWFQSLAWPGIGPDVSGGTITNLGGHVNLNPAAVCYFTIMGGAANGSGAALPFNAQTCYGSGY